MVTIVVGSNLTVAYFQLKFIFFDSFLCNYFRLSEVFHKHLIQFSIQHFFNILNEFDSDLKFIFEELT